MFEGRAKIVLTRRWPSRVEARMAELGELIRNEDDVALSPEQLAAALAEADVVCPTVTDSMPAELFRSEHIRTRLLANYGVGVNHIDLAAASALGIRVTNTPHVLTHATAELALTLMLMSARRAGEGERQVREKNWRGWRPTHMLSTQVTGKTLGIIGMGRIGLALAHKAFHGLDMRIIYHNRRPLSGAAVSELKARYLPLDDLLETADFVSVHCPATPETHHLLNRQKLSLMGSHAHLINTARGEVIDEAALVKALQAGVIAGAGLDVYEAEPQLTEGLRELDQVVLLPHMGSGTRETREAMGMQALANVEAFLQGRTLPNPVQV